METIKAQYIGEGHTIILPTSKAKEKVKVVQGEIIELEADLYSAARLFQAGFQLIEDAAEDAIDAVGDAVKDITEVITDKDLDGDGKIGDEKTPETKTPAKKEAPKKDLAK